MRRISELFALVICLGLTLGCGAEKGAPPEGAKAMKYRLAVIPKGTTHEFWQSVHFGAAKAANERDDVEIIWKGPLTESDRDAQISLVEDFITKRVNGICLAPLDSQALVKSVASAKEQGIPTVIFDSALSDERDIVSYVATDNYRCGAMAARYMGKLLDNKGKVILLRYNPGSESTEQREQGFLDTLTKEFPEIVQLSTNQHSGTSFEDSHTKAQQILLKFGDEVDGVFTVCEPNSTGMLRALEARGKDARKVRFIAFDPNARLIQGMRDGLVDGIVLQDPVEMGYQAVKTLIEKLEGKEVAKRVPIAEYIATPENMAEPDMVKLLTPERLN